MIESEDQIKYRIKIDKSALKFLESLDDFKYEHLINSIFLLEKNPRPVGCTKLSVDLGYRIKWSNYRILYLIDDSIKQINIYKIGHRREVYRNR